MYSLVLAMLILLLGGVDFWWLDPKVETLSDGLWLAFTTAATVGYGDVVPTTPASKIFAVGAARCFQILPWPGEDRNHPLG